VEEEDHLDCIVEEESHNTRKRALREREKERERGVGVGVGAQNAGITSSPSLLPVLVTFTEADTTAALALVAAGTSRVKGAREFGSAARVWFCCVWFRCVAERK
jgi:hypothetical protein